MKYIFLLFTLALLGAGCSQSSQQARIPTSSAPEKTDSAKSLELFTDKKVYSVGDEVVVTLKNNADETVSVAIDSCDGAEATIAFEKKTAKGWMEPAEDGAVRACHIGALIGCTSLEPGKEIVLHEKRALVPSATYRFSLMPGCDEGLVGPSEASPIFVSNAFQTTDQPDLLKELVGVVGVSEGDQLYSIVKTATGDQYAMIFDNGSLRPKQGAKIIASGYFMGPTFRGSNQGSEKSIYLVGWRNQ